MGLLLIYFSSNYFKFKNKYCMGLLLIFPTSYYFKNALFVSF
jgi:hypothetical protein